MIIIRILILVILLLLLAPFAEGGLSAFHNTSNLKIIVAYDQATEIRMKESLKMSFPEKESFLNKHRIINIIIEGNDEFCANEFLVADGKNGIEVVLMLFTARNVWIEDYCHQVKGHSWGLLFIPLGASRLDFNFRNVHGEMDIGVEYPI